MSEEDEQMFKTAEECHICGQKYLNAEVRVRDHCHITGKYRGSANQDCNLKLRISAETFKLSVIFHNLRGYAATLSCRRLVPWERIIIWK